MRSETKKTVQKHVFNKEVKRKNLYYFAGHMNSWTSPLYKDSLDDYIHDGTR